MIKKKLIVMLALILSLCMLLSACDFSIGDISGTDNPSKTEKNDDKENNGKLVNLESFLKVYDKAYEKYELTVNTYEIEDFFKAIAFAEIALAGNTLATGPIYDSLNPNNKDGKYNGSLLGTIERNLEKKGKDITFGYSNTADEDFFDGTKKGDLQTESGVADLDKGYIKYEYTSKRGDDLIKRDYEEAYVIADDEIVIAGAYGKLERERETKDSMHFVRITKDVLEFVMIEGLFGTDYEFIPLNKDTKIDDIKNYCEDNGLEITISGTIKGETVTID